MARNGSGTMSIINTFVPFTTADANDVNEDFDDIANELTNSLPRDGQAGMLAQFKADDGTVLLPGITFTNDLDTGVRRVGANKLAIVTAGADKMTFDAWGPIATLLKGMLWGLTLSNNVADATNDIDIAVGYAASDSAVPELMTLGTAITKRLDAGWAVGTGQGGLDTGSIADTTYHVFLIQRSDTGVVDVLFSTSATSPTMPANYDRKRRIGSILRESAAIVPFSQDGDEFLRKLPAVNVNAVIGSTSASVQTLSIPNGIQLTALFRGNIQDGTTIASAIVLFTSLDETDRAPGSGDYNAQVPAVAVPAAFALAIRTNTSRQIRLRCGNTTSLIQVGTYGWIDTRGRVA